MIKFHREKVTLNLRIKIFPKNNWNKLSVRYKANSLQHHHRKITPHKKDFFKRKEANKWKAVQRKKGQQYSFHQLIPWIALWFFQTATRKKNHSSNKGNYHLIKAKEYIIPPLRADCWKTNKASLNFKPTNSWNQGKREY